MKDTKEHILLTTLQLFMKKGYKEVTLKDIVKNTGVSSGAFYHYFDSKEKVFAEVVSLLFGDSQNNEFIPPTGSTLKEYYSTILVKLKATRKRIENLPKVNKNETSNYYYLVFDAMRILPKFRDAQNASQVNELKSWMEVVETARKEKEIESSMTDEQIAKLFIYLSDGINIKKVTSNNSAKLEKELKELWDCLYDSIKAK